MLFVCWLIAEISRNRKFGANLFAVDSSAAAHPVGGDCVHNSVSCLHYLIPQAVPKPELLN